MLKKHFAVAAFMSRKMRRVFSQLKGLAVVAALGISLSSSYAQTVIPPASAAPAGSVDLTKPGFRLRIVQGPSTPGFPNTSARAEAQLAGTYIDPATGSPYLNEADLTGVGPDGYFVITNVINFTADAGSAGNFQPDERMPGIPDTQLHTDNIAGEILTFLDLSAGTNTFGFNSDDGFRMTVGVGRNPKDSFAQQVGIFEGGRGAGDSIYSVVIQQAGLYPVRIIWYEGGGGANFEFFSMNSAGIRTLVNDQTDPASIKAYREATGATPPYATAVTPAPGATGVGAQPRLSVSLVDQGTTVNTNVLSLSLNGTTLSSTITKVDSNTTITATSSTILPAGSTNTAQLIYADSAGSRITNTWQFVVQSYVTLAAASAHPTASVDTNSSGFQTYIVQADAVPTLPNTSARAESQLAGTYIDPATGVPYPNVATPGAWGTTRFTNVMINFGSDGNFQPDDPIPGIPGTTLAGDPTDSIAGEFVTFLKLDPGVYTFGVNSDDGFRVTSGLNPRSSSAVQLGIFEGGRGASDTLFDVAVTNSGIYPFRIVWYEGGGGANVEFFSVTASGERILINDRTNANAVIAYLSSSLTLPPIVQSVSPTDGTRAARGTDNVVIRLADQTSAVATNSIAVTFNGSSVVPTIDKQGGLTTITYDPPGDLATGSSNVVRLIFADDSSPANRFTNTYSFIIGGDLTRKVYNDINGTAVADLINNAKYIDNTPDLVDTVPMFETPPDVADNYGAEILGYFTPTATDAYTFYLSADDGAVLYLSTDASPANRVAIATQPSWNGSREYVSGENTASRKSAPQNLVVGQRYFIQAIFKEGGGGDNLAVAVRTPSNPTIANGDPPISGPEISPFVGVGFLINPASQTVLVGRPVTFSGLAIAGSGGGMTYEFPRNGVPIPGATAPTYTIPSVTSGDNGAQFSLRATAGATVAVSPIATLTVSSDAIAPTITVGALTNNLIGVCFSEAVQAAGATNPANYTVSGATVTDARLSFDGMTVFLTVIPVGANANYTVTVANTVVDLAGNPVSSTPVPGTVNNSYLNIDIGGPAEAGAAVSCAPGDFDITAGGSDIWGAADQEHFVGQLVSGDFDKRVQVEYLEPVNRWSKAGIQVREDLDGDSRALTAYVVPAAVTTQDGEGGGLGNNLYEAGVRSVKAGDTAAWHTSQPIVRFPNNWIRVTRVGNVFTGYLGTNGTDWTQFARNIPSPAYPTAIYLGLALTSHNNNPGFTADARFRSYGDVVAGARLNLPTVDRTTRDVTISWTGPGRLQEADVVTGPYTTSANQANPQTRTGTTANKFFRIINP